MWAVKQECPALQGGEEEYSTSWVALSFEFLPWIPEAQPADLFFLPAQDPKLDPRCTIGLRLREQCTLFSFTKWNSDAFIQSIKTNITFGHHVWKHWEYKDTECQNHTNVDGNKCQDHSANIWNGESIRIWPEFMKQCFIHLGCLYEISVSTRKHGNIFGQPS